nr:hypothetical protein [Tanacetum cinerariifolium]
MALARSGACPCFFCRTREYPCRIFSLCSVIERGTPVMCFGSHAKISRFLCKTAHIAAMSLSDSDLHIDTSYSGRYGGVVDGDNALGLRRVTCNCVTLPMRYGGVVDGDNAAFYKEFKHPVSRGWYRTYC